MRIVVTNNGRKVIQEIEDITLPSINSKSHNNIRNQNDVNQKSITLSTDRKSTHKNNIKFIKLNPKKYNKRRRKRNKSKNMGYSRTK